MQTFENWETIEVSAQTGSSKNGNVRYFSFKTPVPTLTALDDLADGLGKLGMVTVLDDNDEEVEVERLVPAILDAKRMLQLAYAQLKIANRPNPYAKAGKALAKEAALAEQNRLAKLYLSQGMDVDEALDRAANEAAATPPTPVEVHWIVLDDETGADDKVVKFGKTSLDAAEKELLKRIH